MQSVYIPLALFEFAGLVLVYFGYTMLQRRRAAERGWPRVVGKIAGVDTWTKRRELRNETVTMAHFTFEYDGKEYEKMSHYNIRRGDINADGTIEVLVNKDFPEKSLQYIKRRFYDGPAILLITGGLFSVLTIIVFVLLRMHVPEAF
jgi:hypothetical protein